MRLAATARQACKTGSIQWPHGNGKTWRSAARHSAARHSMAHLLAGHELQGAVGAKVQHRVSLQRGTPGREVMGEGGRTLGDQGLLLGRRHSATAPRPAHCSMRSMPGLNARSCVCSSEYIAGRTHPEDLLQVGVVGGKAVVGAGRLGEQQAHRVALVAAEVGGNKQGLGVVCISQLGVCRYVRAGSGGLSGGGRWEGHNR